MATTNLSIGDADESLVDQFVPQWVPGLALHDVTLCCLVSKRDGWYLTEETAREKARETLLLWWFYLQFHVSAAWPVKAYASGYILHYYYRLFQHATLSKHEKLDWSYTAT